MTNCCKCLLNGCSAPAACAPNLHSQQGGIAIQGAMQAALLAADPAPKTPGVDQAHSSALLRRLGKKGKTAGTSPAQTPHRMSCTPRTDTIILSQQPTCHHHSSAQCRPTGETLGCPHTVSICQPSKGSNPWGAGGAGAPPALQPLRTLQPQLLRLRGGALAGAAQCRQAGEARAWWQ